MKGKPELVFRTPDSSSTRLSFNSLIHSGCVKSLVPNSVTPLILAHFSRVLMLKAEEHALLKRECTCKSARCCILFEKEMSLKIL